MRGYLTWNLRSAKVKCDETKPTCHRCTRLDLECGYPPPKPLKSDILNSEKPSKRILLPAITLDPTGQLFASQKEWQYFQLYRTEAAPELTGIFSQSLWNRIMLQACHGEAFVREAVVAISASMIVRNLKWGKWNDVETPGVSEHREAALAHYGKALKRMKEELALQQENPRRLLIACLLVCCLEGMWASSCNAMAHASSGQKVLKRWLAKTPQLRTSQVGIRSPAPDVVEDDIIQAFARLDIQIMTFLDMRTLEEHTAMLDEGTETVMAMPSNFAALDEARLYFDLIERRALHFIRIASLALYPVRNIVPDPITDTDEKEDPSWVKAVPLGQKISEDQSFYYLTSQQKYAAELKRWNEAFQPLYKRMQQAKDHLSIPAHLLFVNFTAVEIMLTEALAKDNSSSDQHLGRFKTVVSVSRLILEAKQLRRYSFSFDCGLTPWLATVAQLCHDRKLRREGITLLRQMGSQEGVWNSFMVAELGEYLMNFEEEGVETYEIPEESRVRMKRVNMSFSDRLLTIELTRGASEDRTIEKVVDVNWPFGEWV